MIFLLVVLALLEAVHCITPPPTPSSILEKVRIRPVTANPRRNYITTLQQASKRKYIMGEIFKIVGCVLPKIINSRDEVDIEALDLSKIFSAIMKCSSSLLEYLHNKETLNDLMMRELAQELKDEEVKEAVDQKITREKFLKASFPLIGSILFSRAVGR